MRFKPVWMRAYGGSQTALHAGSLVLTTANNGEVIPGVKGILGGLRGLEAHQFGLSDCGRAIVEIRRARSPGQQSPRIPDIGGSSGKAVIDISLILSGGAGQITRF